VLKGLEGVHEQIVYNQGELVDGAKNKKKEKKVEEGVQDIDVNDVPEHMKKAISVRARASVLTSTHRVGQSPT
jgi:hypothetical protein